MSVIGNSPGVASQRVVSPFTATSGQTTFTPISGYTLGYCDVFLNGIKLANGDDYTASNGTTVVLSVGAALGDFVEVVAYFPRGLSDGYLKAEADGRFLSSTDGSVTTAKLAANAVTAAKIASGAAVSNIGYTPLNKAGDNLTGGNFPLSAFITLDTTQANGYPRLNGSSSSAQLGLFRSAGGAEGGMYIGATGEEFAVWDQSFNRRLIVDQAGRVKMPYQPAFAYAGTSYTQGSSATTIIPATTLLNRGGHYNGGTGVFTAPVGGVYHFAFFGLAYPLPEAERISLRYRKNGSNVVAVEHNGNTNSHMGVSGCMTVELSANDTVDLQFNRDSGYAASAYSTQWHMCGHLIG